MLNNIIDFVAIIIICIYLYRDNEKYAWLLYIAFSCTMPWFVIGDYRISFEILMFFPMFFVHVMYYGKSKKICFSNTENIFIFLFIYSMLITLNREIYENYLNIYRVFSAFRFIAIIHIIKELIDEDAENDFDKMILMILSVNCVFIMIQSVFPSETMQMWTQLYDSPSRKALEGDFIRFGFMSRPVGTLGSPTILGMFNCIMTAYLVGRFCTRKNKKIYFFIGMVMTGFIAVSSFSKTAMIGWGIYAFVASFILFRRGYYCALALILIIPMSLILIYINIFPDNASHVMTMLELFNNPNRAFNTRFGDSGSTWGALSMALEDEYFMFGVSRDYPNIFVGDVLYVEQLYRYGVIGLVLYTIFLLYPMIIAIRKHNLQVLVMMSSLFMIGLASPSQYWFLAAFILGISIKSIKANK